MSDDTTALVARLRTWGVENCPPDFPQDRTIEFQAASAIERLERELAEARGRPVVRSEWEQLTADRDALAAENARLREALRIPSEVVAELDRALAKFPTWPTDPLHALAVLGEEFGELTKAVLQLTYEPHKSASEDMRIEAIQTAAMAIRFVASLDAYRFQRCHQHDQALAAPKGAE